MYFNQSIVTSIFPDEWKNARVTPLLKNARKNTERNIDQSQLVVVAKAFESVISDQLYYCLKPYERKSSPTQIFSSFCYSQTMSYVCQKCKNIGGSLASFSK